MFNDGQGGISQPGFEAFTEPVYSPGYDASTDAGRGESQYLKAEAAAYETSGAPLPQRSTGA